MAQNFIACDRDQPFLLPPDVRQWLPEGHLAWFVIDAVGVMDTAAFYAAYRQDGHGRAAYEPSMMVAARRELAAAGVTRAPEVVIADAGYWHLEQINEITGNGIPLLIPPDSSRRANKPKRPGWTGGAYDFMRSVLATELGGKLYKQRAQLVEPIFGHTKHNRRFDRFHRRGRSAARTEWRLVATTHNLLKLHQHFTAAVA